MLKYWTIVHLCPWLYCEVRLLATIVEILWKIQLWILDHDLFTTLVVKLIHLPEYRAPELGYKPFDDNAGSVSNFFWIFGCFFFVVFWLKENIIKLLIVQRVDKFDI